MNLRTALGSLVACVVVMPASGRPQAPPEPAACRGFAGQLRATASVSRDGDHFVVDLTVTEQPLRTDIVIGPSVVAGYGVDRVLDSTVRGGTVHVRFVPRAEGFGSAQIGIPTRCAAGVQMTIASVITGSLARLPTLAPRLDVELMEGSTAMWGR